MENLTKVKLFLRLRKNKVPTVLTREPGGTKSAELIRDLILKDYFKKSKEEKFDKYTDTLLYLAARNEHVKNKIKPELDKKVVICDRFVDSTLAYQVFGKKVSLNFIKNIQKVILGDLKPNITFILKVSPKSSKKRLRKENLKIDMIIFHKNFIINSEFFPKDSKKKKKITSFWTLQMMIIFLRINFWYNFKIFKYKN